MVQRTVIEFIDDLDGKPIRHGGGETVTFALEGVEYEVDLSKTNADKLRKALNPFVGAARTVGGKRGRRHARVTSTGVRDYDIAALRAWAKSNKVAVPPRGRIPSEIVEKFKAAMR